MRRVEGGREIDHPCPECEKVTPWAECEVKDEFSTFFTTRRMVCTVCGEEVPLDDLGPPRGEIPPQKRSTEWDKDALLAALKEKMTRAGKK